MAEVLRVIWGNRETDYFRGRSFFDLRRRANQCWAASSEMVNFRTISTVSIRASAPEEWGCIPAPGGG